MPGLFFCYFGHSILSGGLGPGAWGGSQQGEPLLKAGQAVEGRIVGTEEQLREWQMENQRV